MALSYVSEKYFVWNKWQRFLSTTTGFWERIMDKGLSDLQDRLFQRIRQGSYQDLDSV